MINKIVFYLDDTNNITVNCVVKNIKISSINKIQVSNSVTKKDAIINRTGAWNREISINMAVRDDMVQDDDGNLSITNDENSLVLLKVKMESIKKILKNDSFKKRNTKVGLLSENISYEERLNPLLKILNNKIAINKEDGGKEIKMILESLNYRTDQSNNITDISITGTPYFYGEFTNNNFSEVVLKDV